MTGTALHIFPILTMWNIHCNLHGTVEREEWGFYNTDHIGFDIGFLATYFGYFMTFYAIWAVVHYSILYICWDMMFENQYYCMFLDKLIRGKGVKSIREKYGKLAAKIYVAWMHFYYVFIMAVAMIPAFFSKIY